MADKYEKLKQLRKAAKDSAKFYGHKLGRWTRLKRSADQSTQVTFCRACELKIVVKADHDVPISTSGPITLCPMSSNGKALLGPRKDRIPVRFTIPSEVEQCHVTATDLDTVMGTQSGQ